MATADIDIADPRVEIVALEKNAFTAKVKNTTTGAFALVVVDGAVDVASARSALASAAIDSTNTTSELFLAETRGSATVAPGLLEADLVAFLASVDGLADVNPIDQDDTARLEVLGAGAYERSSCLTRTPPCLAVPTTATCLLDGASCTTNAASPVGSNSCVACRHIEETRKSSAEAYKCAV